MNTRNINLAHLDAIQFTNDLLGVAAFFFELQNSKNDPIAFKIA